MGTCTRVEEEELGRNAWSRDLFQRWIQQNSLLGLIQSMRKHGHEQWDEWWCHLLRWRKKLIGEEVGLSGLDMLYMKYPLAT